MLFNNTDVNIPTVFVTLLVLFAISLPGIQFQYSIDPR